MNPPQAGQVVKKGARRAMRGEHVTPSISDTCTTYVCTCICMGGSLGVLQPVVLHHRTLSQFVCICVWLMNKMGFQVTRHQASGCQKVGGARGVWPPFQASFSESGAGSEAPGWNYSWPGRGGTVPSSGNHDHHEFIVMGSSSADADPAP